MTNSLFATARAKALDPGLDWPAGFVSALLLTDEYVPDLEVDTNISDVPAGAILATVDLLADKAGPDGYAQSTSVFFEDVESLVPATALLLHYRFTGQLLLYVDDADGLPFLPAVGGSDTWVLINEVPNAAWFRI